jgi:hypothetical protein
MTKYVGEIISSQPVCTYKDPINPEHYKTGGLETIKILEAKLTKEQLKGFYLGNVIKYVTRAEYKNGSEDLKKAQYYLNKLVELEDHD